MLGDQLSDDLSALAASAEFARMRDAPPDRRALWFAKRRAALGLDFLYYLPREAAYGGAPGESAIRWPVIAAGLRGHARTAIDIFGPEDLRAIDPALMTRTRLALIEIARQKLSIQRAEIFQFQQD